MAVCREIEAHLKECPACQREVRLLELTCMSVRSLQNPKAPNDFLSRLRQRIDREVPQETLSLWKAGTRWLMGHPAMLAAGFSVVFVFAFVLGRLAPTPQIAPVTAEMEPARAYKNGLQANVAYTTEVRSKAEERETAEVAMDNARPSPPTFVNRMESPSLAQAVSFSALGAPAPSETVQPRAMIQLQTPTQLIVTLVRNDPLFENALIYPIREGAVVQTENTVYRITISDQNFINALGLIREHQGIPASIDDAVRLLKLDVERMPNPLAK